MFVLLITQPHAWAGRPEPDVIRVRANAAEDSVRVGLPTRCVYTGPEGSPIAGKGCLLVPWTLPRRSWPRRMRWRRRSWLGSGRRVADPRNAAEVEALGKLLRLDEWAGAGRSSELEASVGHLRGIRLGPGSEMWAVPLSEHVATLTLRRGYRPARQVRRRGRGGDRVLLPIRQSRVERAWGLGEGEPRGIGCRNPRPPRPAPTLPLRKDGERRAWSGGG
jgi:hypothetical protein